MSAGKSVLLVIDSAPYGNWRGREILDMAFAMAAFDKRAALLFTGAGVNWLRDGQDPAKIGQKSVLRHLSAAGLFGIETVYADSESLRRFGIEAVSAGVGITETGSPASLYTDFDHVVQL